MLVENCARCSTVCQDNSIDAWMLFTKSPNVVRNISLDGRIQGTLTLPFFQYVPNPLLPKNANLIRIGDHPFSTVLHHQAILQTWALLIDELAPPVAVHNDSRGTASDSASSNHQWKTVLLLLRNYSTTRSPSQC
jgi:hypothetical protein